MDYIFQFVQPFVDFFCKYYLNGCFIFIFVLITSVAIAVHLSKDKKGNHTMSLDDVCVSLMMGAVLVVTWPVIVSLAFFAGICYLYYYLVGLILRLVIKRIN